jgi:hypothetical protein
MGRIIFAPTKIYFMKKMVFALATLMAAGTMACNSGSEAPKDETTVVADTATVQAPDANAPQTMCFRKTFNQDTTTVKLTLKGDTVEGTMVWQPWQKDGGRGTLKGLRDANGEMNLMYDYMIEGVKQTETKIMKLDGDKLLVKVGELQDLKNDGNLTFKDVTKAVYKDTLYTCTDASCATK